MSFFSESSLNQLLSMEVGRFCLSAEMKKMQLFVTIKDSRNCFAQLVMLSSAFWPHSNLGNCLLAGTDEFSLFLSFVPRLGLLYMAKQMLHSTPEVSAFYFRDVCIDAICNIFQVL